MKHKDRYDKAHHLPVETRAFALAHIEGFLGFDYDEDDWDNMASSGRTRRIVLYALRCAEKSPAENRKDQLIQLCRKFTAAQPRYWPRFLRERYQYANTKDFFDVPYQDIRYEFFAYEDEAHSLSADPDETGRVFDAKEQWAKEIAPLLSHVGHS